MPTTISLASISLFNSKAPSFSNLSLGSQGATPSQVDGMSSCDGSHGMALTVVNRARVCPHLGCFVVSCHVCTHPLVAAPQVFACGGASSSCLPCHKALHSLRCLPSSGLPCSGASTSRLALAFAQGTNASDLVAVALSASLAGSTLEVPLARAGPTLPSFMRVDA